jgi:hypothetical protein
MLYTPEGKPRLAIVSIAHLDDAQRMFFVTILLNEILSWIRTQPGTSSLRALLYMDEVFGYFPPLANPPAKRPMLTLLKQARAFGLGCVLATQNPVDLDYKGLSNAGTWFLGRLQTERDKARVIEGLEGASAEAGAGFDRGKMEATLAALGARVFLMNNVHEDKPVVFHTRWAMSYLCGPLTRTQIKTLMDPLRARAGTAPGAPTPAAATRDVPGRRRPVLPAGIPEKFALMKLPANEGDRIEYRPALLGHGKVHFVRKADGIDVWRERRLMKVIGDMRPTDMWQGALAIENSFRFDNQPDQRGEFAVLPSEFAREKSYSAFPRSLRDHLYRDEKFQMWRCEALSETSRGDEDEAAFRSRLGPLLEQQLRHEREKLENAYAKKLADADAKIERAESRLSTQRWQFFARAGRLAWAVADTAASAIGRGLPGRRRSLDSALGSAASERGQQSNAQMNFDKAVEEKARLQDELQDKLAAVDSDFDPKLAKIEAIELKPQKSDIEVDEVSLVWLPFRIDSAGNAQPIY